MANRAEFLSVYELRDIHPLVDQAMQLDDGTEWSRTRIIRFLRCIMDILGQEKKYKTSWREA